MLKDCELVGNRASCLGRWNEKRQENHLIAFIPLTAQLAPLQGTGPSFYTLTHALCAGQCVHTHTHTHTHTYTHPISGSESQSLGLGARGCSSACPCLPFYDSTKGGGGAGPSAPRTSPCANWRCQLALGWGCHIPPFPESLLQFLREGLLSTYLGGQTPARAGPYGAQAYPPPDGARTSSTEEQPSLRWWGFPHWRAGRPGPRGAWKGSSPPLLIHLQYEEVWGTLPGEGALAWR